MGSGNTAFLQVRIRFAAVAAAAALGFSNSRPKIQAPVYTRMHFDAAASSSLNKLKPKAKRGRRSMRARARSLYNTIRLAMNRAHPVLIRQQSTPYLRYPRAKRITRVKLSIDSPNIIMLSLRRGRAVISHVSRFPRALRCYTLRYLPAESREKCATSPERRNADVSSPFTPPR